MVWSDVFSAKKQTVHLIRARDTHSLREILAIPVQRSRSGTFLHKSGRTVSLELDLSWVLYFKSNLKNKLCK